jgi:ArsR family transcriptional regulator, zinc-responsive transcriptional repressor
VPSTSAAFPAPDTADKCAPNRHLRVLRSSRIVTARRQAREIEHTLTDDHVAHIVLDAIRHAGEA